MVAESIGPELDRLVTDGLLEAWGWVANYSGGTWDRELYVVTPTLADLMVRLDRWRESARQHITEMEVLRSVCAEREDYVWRLLFGSEMRPDAPRPSAEFVTYYECADGRGKRADEIIRSTLRPLLEAEIRDGAITAWSWHEQVAGGPFTRILIIEGQSHKGNIQSVDRIRKGMSLGRAEEFGEMCPSHQDYLWTIQRVGS
jgi:hypothetical protein